VELRDMAYTKAKVIAKTAITKMTAIPWRVWRVARRERPLTDDRPLLLAKARCIMLHTDRPLSGSSF